ncbi:hypothetical protein M0R45_015562 [Rubus argutus]|uniref:Galactose oxidase/kelch repeat superfamily protein n=1 Tax=Rubus argutus TaxID=59490 RepID=A0AAW1XQL0_RUBAR
MAPDRSVNLATREGEEERHHWLRRCREHGHRCHEAHRRDGCVTMKKMKKKKKKSRVTKEKKAVGLKLEGEEANKSLYICYLEHHVGSWVAYVVHSIKLSDLLSSTSFDHALQLRQVAYKAGLDLPGSVRCGVWGSQILFIGGMKPSFRFGLGACESNSVVWHRDVYAFETDQPQRRRESNIISKMDASFTLLQGKFNPLTVELRGKLYALSSRLVDEPPSFEVFDPKVGSWAPLPQPPFFKERSPYHHNGNFSYAIAGTKMFVCHEKCPVFCFDVAHPHREWRLVPTMCQGGPFPFVSKALVLDLPADDKKIMFAYSHRRWCLGVYLMSLVENEESITRIGDLKLPMLPLELGVAEAFQFVHIGGQKACLVVTQLGLPYEDDQAEYEPGTHKTWGVAIPFQFQVDITKVDKGKKDCFTLQFMPPCIFNFYTNPSTFPKPEPAGCFVL